MKLKIQQIPRLILRFKYLIFAAMIGLGFILLSPVVYTTLSTRGERFDPAEVKLSQIPQHDVVIIFGAGINARDGTPTPYLRNRILTGIELYKAGRVSKLLMTGDNSSRGYSEPDVMTAYAVKRGVPEQVIVQDYAGYNTYDSCYRAKHIFKLDDALLITQAYHLPRAMTTCRWLGIENHGVEAVRNSRDWAATYLLREAFSTNKMVIQQVLKPEPLILGDPMPVQLD